MRLSSFARAVASTSNARRTRAPTRARAFGESSWGGALRDAARERARDGAGDDVVDGRPRRRENDWNDDSNREDNGGKASAEESERMRQRKRASDVDGGRRERRETTPDDDDDEFGSTRIRVRTRTKAKDGRRGVMTHERDRGASERTSRRNARDASERAGEVASERAPPTPTRKGERRFYATCHPGLENVVARELASREINARDIAIGKSGVSFTGTQRVGYDANVWLRSAVRVLVELKRGYLDPNVSGTESIYNFVKNAVPWAEVIPEKYGLKFGVETRVWDCSQISSSHAAKVRVKDAICDALVDATGTRPSPPENYAAADVPLFVTLYRDEAILYRDMSGESLHRRGYRTAMHRASLSESAAAGMLSLAGWPQMLSDWRRDPERSPPPVLIDPMCGSGTFLIEGALMAANVAPGLIRSETIGYAFERWPDHNPRTFEESLANARRIGAETRAASSSMPLILGNDIHPGAVTLAGQGAETARVGGMISVYRNNCEIFSLKSMNIDSASPRIVVTNPPWGKRLGGETGPPRGRDRREAENDDGKEFGNEFGDDVYDRDTTPESEGMSPEEALEQVWNSLGVFLKRECPDTSAFVLSGNPEVSRAIRMRASRKMPLGIGGVDCRLLRYDILPPKPEGFESPTGQGRVSKREY